MKPSVLVMLLGAVVPGLAARCTIDTTWRRWIPRKNKTSSENHCGWVGGDPSDRCHVKDRNRVKAWHACSFYCDPACNYTAPPKTTTPLRPRGIRVACVGDSITEGLNARSYPEWLQYLLMDQGVDVVNHGEHGRTVPMYNADWLLESGFELAIIMLGTNDAKVAVWNETSYRRDYRRLIQKFVTVEGGDVMLGIPIPYHCVQSCSPHYSSSRDMKWGDDTTIINEVLPRVARDIADDFGLATIDFAVAMGGAEPIADYYENEIHPNARGYHAMGLAATRAVLEWLSLRGRQDPGDGPTGSSTRDDVVNPLT